MSELLIHHLITSLHGGGTEYFLWLMLRHAPPGVQQHVFYLKQEGVFADRIRSLGISVEPVTMVDFYRQLKRDRPHVLHTCLFRAHQVGRIIGKLAGAKRIVSSQRSIDAWAGQLHETVDAWTLRYCDGILANSKAAEDVVMRRRGMRETPEIRRIYNALEQPAVQRIDSAEARRTLRLPEKTILVGTLLRLHPEKGADKLLDLANKLFSQSEDIHLVIGGTGPLETALRKQCADSKAASRIHWLGWVNDPRVFLSALDYYVCLSREESFSQALLEASALGIPWYSTRVGGVSELIEAGAKGRIFHSLDHLLQQWPLPFQESTMDIHRHDPDEVSREFYSFLSGGRL